MPELSQSSLAAAAAVGDASAAAAIIAADPVAVRRPAGPFHWEPLLYLTYSRIAQQQTGGDAVATARVLLAAGADPNAGYLWEGLVPPFTALTGVFGGGEGSQPQHPRWRELGELLLAAGADPNDGQTIYNRGLGDLPHDDTAFLELLFRHGLGTDTPSPWRDGFGGQLHEPADLLAEVLQHAAEADLPQRAALVLAHGADPDRPARHPVFAGRTPLQSALRHGNLAIARLLEAAGADATVVDDRLRLQAVLLAGDAGAARTADADREAIERLRAAEPLLVIDAAQLRRSTAVEALVSLGWDVNAHGRTSALHLAALAGDDAMVEVLLRLGADPTWRDAEFDAPAAGWAAHGGHADLATRLSSAADAWPSA
jgi:ankyrin repeat protein